MFLGIDIGTTAIKIGLLEERKIIYQRSFPIYTKTEKGRTTVCVRNYSCTFERDHGDSLLFTRANNSDWVQYSDA